MVFHRLINFCFLQNVVLTYFPSRFGNIRSLVLKCGSLADSFDFQAGKNRLKLRKSVLLLQSENMLVFSTDSTENISPKGQIQIIFGPMFSGKTTELIRRVRRYQIAKHKCLIIKYANDVRYDVSAVATHDSQTLEAVSSTTLSDLKEEAIKYSVIGIDEGQFFPDTVSFAEAMANAGKVVIIAALDGTFQRKSFGDILQLVPLAESVIKLTAVCMVCFEDASFTKRIGNETKLEVIGGTDKYMAVCRRCYGIKPTSEVADKLCITDESKENQEPL